MAKSKLSKKDYKHLDEAADNMMAFAAMMKIMARLAPIIEDLNKEAKKKTPKIA